jgi:two-component system, LuxR family, sensor kinase FixL
MKEHRAERADWRQRTWEVAALYGTLHGLLDWLSATGSLGATGITPWNLSVGLGFVLVYEFGPRLAPLIPLAGILSAFLFRAPSEELSSALIESAIIGVGYALAALVLAHPALSFDPRFERMRDLFTLIGTAVISSALVSVVLVGALWLVGAVAPNELFAAAIRQWIGDLLGISIVAPVGLLAVRGTLPLRLTRQGAAQIAITAAILAFILILQGRGHLTYFYFLFFPVMWIALTAGLHGTCLALAFVQVAMLLAARAHLIEFDVTEFQARLVALTATGLVAGALVSERKREEERSRQQQAALAEVATRGSMGELGTAIAHEVNQPLSAAGTFANLVVESLATETLRDPTAMENAQKVVRQIERASQVVQRLRALVRLARDGAAYVRADLLLAEVSDIMRNDVERAGIQLRCSVPAGLPLVHADRLQIEQALINLVRNSLEAVDTSTGVANAIELYAEVLGPGLVELGVQDTGPGFPEHFSVDSVQPFSTSKQEGFGIGLSLCRSIARANRGSLVVHRVERGARVGLRLNSKETVE